MELFTVAFFGHRVVEDYVGIENALEDLVWRLAEKNTFVDFLVGRNGEFDSCAARVVKRLKRECGDGRCALVLMLPYKTAEYLKNTESFEDFYDIVEVSFNASVALPKAAIQIRNREMVDRADLIICYVNRRGGAYDTIEYAKKCKKKSYM